jgi:hypothetical protein
VKIAPNPSKDKATEPLGEEGEGKGNKGRRKDGK